MDVLNSRLFPMPKTRTYAKREAQWYGQDANGFGAVIIRLWHGERAGSKLVERDLYQVAEEEPDPGVMCRQFRFLNRTDPKQKFPYKVRIGLNHSCTCDAGRARVAEDHGSKGCKHRDACLAALDSGFWDGTDDDAGEPRYADEPGEPTAYELMGAV